MEDLGGRIRLRRVYSGGSWSTRCLSSARAGIVSTVARSAGEHAAAIAMMPTEVMGSAVALATRTASRMMRAG